MGVGASQERYREPVKVKVKIGQMEWESSACRAIGMGENQMFWRRSSAELVAHSYHKSKISVSKKRRGREKDG